VTALLLKAAKRTVRSVLSFGLVCTTYALVAEASGLGQPDSQTAKTQRSGNKTTTLLVDTDDTCHLFVDGEDKGTITPNAPQKFMTGPDEHILKCSVDSIPDLVWRKVVDAKGSSQIVAAISLKALHVQYDQALSTAKNQNAQADSLAAKQLEEAELEEKQRRAAKEASEAAIVKMFDSVKGSWHGPAWNKVLMQWDFRTLQSGLVVAYANWGSSRDKFIIVQKYLLRPIPPDRFDVLSEACVSTNYRNLLKPGAPKDKNGLAECTNTDDKPIDYEFYFTIHGATVTFHNSGTDADLSR